MNQKRQTFLEYYLMMEVPLGFSFGGATIDKGIDKTAAAASKGIQKYMRRIDLNSMTGYWNTVQDVEVFDALKSQLSSDAQGDKILIKDAYKVNIQGMRDAWVGAFPTILRMSKSGTVDKDSKNRTDQAGEPTEITAFITQSPNRVVKATQNMSKGIGGAMGGKIVFVVTVDENEAEHYYIGADKKAVDSISGITKLGIDTAIKNKTFGKILSTAGRAGSVGKTKVGDWTFYTSSEMNQAEYDDSMNILKTRLKTTFRPAGIDPNKLTITEYKNGPYSGGDSGWLITSTDDNFPNTELAVLGKKNVLDTGETLYNINVYARGVFANPKIVNLVYGIIKDRTDTSKIGKAKIAHPFGKQSQAVDNMPGNEATDNPNKTYELDYEEGDVDGDFMKLSNATNTNELKNIMNELDNKDLSTIVKALVSPTSDKKTPDSKNSLVVSVIDDKIVNIKTAKGAEVMSFGKQENNEAVPAKTILTQLGYARISQPSNPEAEAIKALQFKEGSI